MKTVLCASSVNSMVSFFFKRPVETNDCSPYYEEDLLPLSTEILSSRSSVNSVTLWLDRLFGPLILGLGDRSHLNRFAA